uniref:RING-type E3 ubiquitin transferase n=1 Tax=Anopheles christyi TaxID=43041 RepID=A0A182K1H2_9DIPT
VSCDSCLKSNFRGRRYKCLICYDYDLCATCYEEGATTTRHSTDHPMQCILTQSDFELYYGGEVLQADQPQSFTCPYCKRMGLSDSALLEHVSAEHTDTGLEVVCPVCAALPGGEPNFVTDDFARHLSLEHRSGSRDLISRMPHSGRALGGPRSRRSNMHFSSSGGGLSTLSPSGRESVDPIAELLQQLSNVRRGGAPQPSQLQQLQMQIQLERQQVTAARQQLERLPRRQQQPAVVSSAPNATGVNNNAIGATQANPIHTIITLNAGGRDGPIAASSSLPMVSTGVGGVCNVPGTVGSASGAGTSAQQSQFLMARFMVPTMDDAEQTQLGRDRADRSQFVQALMLSTIANVQPFNKNAEEELSDELSSMNLGVGGGNTCSTVNSSVKRPASDDGGETAGELLLHDGGATDSSNYGKEDGNCDSFKLGADSANGGSNEESPNMMHPSAAHHALGQQQRGGHAGTGKSKSGSSTKSGMGGGAGGGVGGGGGPGERRASRQTPPSGGGGGGTNAAKARELKQANSSSNTSTSVSSRQQHHVPDSR